MQLLNSWDPPRNPNLSVATLTVTDTPLCHSDLVKTYADQTDQTDQTDQSDRFEKPDQFEQDDQAEVPRKVAGALSRYLSQLDPDRITISRAAELYGLFAEIRRLAAAGELLLAPRAVEARDWKDLGHRSAAAWMAATSGTGLGEAISTLETAGRLETLPATADALRNGSLSTQKAKEIAAVAVRRPQAEGELLQIAATGTMKALKQGCRRVSAQGASSEEENARYAAIHAGRYFRHWTDPDGAFKGEFKLTPVQGARLLSSLDVRANALFDEARKTKSHEPAHAYAADALVDLVTGARSAEARAGTVVHVRVDAAALRRGYTATGEVCEIAGVGVVPVATAQALLPEAFVKVLVTDGVDVTTVCHVGRSVSAHLRSAIEERDPTCVVPGCDVATGLEIDHWQTDFAAGGPTALANLARVCHFHHAMKTYRGFELRGGPGKWEWEPPPEFATG